MTPIPGELSHIERRDQLHVFLIVNTSGTLQGEEIRRINETAERVLEILKKYGEERSVAIRLRVITYADTAELLVGNVERGPYVEEVSWEPLTAAESEKADLAGAIRLANGSLRIQYMGVRTLMPTVIFLANGKEALADEETLAAIEEMRTRLTGRNPTREKVHRLVLTLENGAAEVLSPLASATDGGALVFSADEEGLHAFEEHFYQCYPFRSPSPLPVAPTPILMQWDGKDDGWVL